MKTKKLTAAIATAVLGSGSLAIPQLAIAQDLMLEEIVVSAQRREQNILDVPVAVSAFNASQMQEAGIFDIRDLNKAIPGFNIATGSDPVGTTPIRIRGIGTGGNPGFEGAVGTYVDGIYRSRAGTALSTMFDMAGIEILRGPQGTLFGKNTSAGAVQLNTAAPEFDDLYGNVAFEGGNYDTYKLEGYVNVPVNDAMALRFSGLAEETDGYITHPITGRDMIPSEMQAFRAQLAWQVTEDLDLRVILDTASSEQLSNYNRSTRIGNDGGPGNSLNTLWPSLALDTTTGGEGYWYWDVSDPANPGPADPFSYKIATSYDTPSELDQDGLTIHVNYDLSDNLSLRSITGYRDIESKTRNGDWDFGPVDLGSELNEDYGFETFSQEFLLSGSFDLDGGSSIDLVTGINYFDEQLDRERSAFVGEQFGAAFKAIFGGNNPSSPFFTVPEVVFGDPTFAFQDMVFQQNEESVGLFSHVTWNYDENLSFIGGLRWNRIEKDIDYDNLSAANQQDYHDQVASRLLAFYIAGAGTLSPDWGSSITDEEWTYDFTIQYRPTENTQLYAKYAYGFKAGGFNIRFDAAGGTPISPFASNPNQSDDGTGRTFTYYDEDAVKEPLNLTNNIDAISVSYKPEYVDAYELGFRWEYLDRGRLSLTLFRSFYDDLQVSTFNGFAFVVTNAGSSTTEGVELENVFTVNENLTVNFAATYLYALYGPDVVDELPANREQAASPHFVAQTGIRYNQPITDDMQLFANANYIYYTEQYAGANEIDGYGLFDLTVGLHLSDVWTVGAFCRNCFDEEYYSGQFNQPFMSGGDPLGTLGEPSTYGLQISRDF